MYFNQDFDEYEEKSSDEYPELDRALMPRLPVANFDRYDPNQPPVSGDEYLRRVQLEAQNCPEVVVADMDLTKFTANQTSNGFIKCSPELMPSLDWQREQVSDFTNVRIRTDRMKNNRISMGLTDNSPFFRKKSMYWWREFCIGRLSDNSSDSSSDSVYESEQSTPNDTPKSNDSNLKREKPPKPPKPEPNPPLLGIICDMTQEEVIQVLSYHMKWIRQFRFTQQIGLWIYALLVALEKPLPSEVYSMLRELSRVCSESRQKVKSPEESKEEMIALNLIICLIGRYFDQNDMIDE